MSNTNAPFGARPVGHLSGAAWNGKTRMYEFPAGDSAAVYIGDFVKPYDAGGAGAVPWGKHPAATAAAATNTNIIGVVVGFQPDGANLMRNYKPASTLRYGFVVDDPTVLFEIQEDGATDALALTMASIFTNGDMAAGSGGSTTTGKSSHQLDSSDVLTNDSSAASAQLQVMGFVNRPDNAVGAYARWIVRINEHAYGDALAGV